LPTCEWQLIWKINLQKKNVNKATDFMAFNNFSVNYYEICVVQVWTEIKLACQILYIVSFNELMQKNFYENCKYYLLAWLEDVFLVISDWSDAAELTWQITEKVMTTMPNLVVSNMFDHSSDSQSCFLFLKISIFSLRWKERFNHQKIQNTSFFKS